MFKAVIIPFFPVSKTLLVLVSICLCSSLMLAAEPIRFRMAGLKLLPVQWDKAANFEKLELWARRAAAGGADLIMTVEGYLEGYVGNEKFTEGLTRERYRAVGEPIDGEWIQKTKDLAAELEVHFVLGFAERRGDEMYNSVVLISPKGEVIGRYSKAHLMGIEPLNSTGTEFPVFPTELGRIGLLVCFDRQLPETSRILAIKGAQIILVPAFGLGIDEINEDVMMRTRAYENGVYVAHVHPKNTFVVNPRGTIIGQSKNQDEEIVFATITLDDRVGDGPIIHRRPEIYGEILKSRKK